MKKIIAIMMMLVLASGVAAISTGEKIYFLSPGGYTIGYSGLEGDLVTYTENYVQLDIHMANDDIYFDVPVEGTYDIVVKTDWKDDMFSNFEFCGVNEVGNNVNCVSGVRTNNGDGTYTYEFEDVVTLTPTIRASEPNFWIGVGKAYFYGSYLKLISRGDGVESYVNYLNDITIRGLKGYDNEFSTAIYWECGDNNGVQYEYNSSLPEHTVEYLPCKIDSRCDFWVSYYTGGTSNPMTWDYIDTFYIEKDIDMNINPMAGIYTSPTPNDLGNPIILREYGNQSFTVQPYGQAYESINWTLRKYQDESVLKYGSGAEFDLWGYEVEAGETYILEAEILNACGTNYLDRIDFYIFVPCEFSTIEGNVYRYNETDTWPVTNGTIEIGLLYNSSFDDAGHYKIEDVSEGCYGVKVYDYDIEGTETPAWTSPLKECINQNINYSLEIPTGFESTYNLTVCFYDSTEDTRLGDGHRIRLHTDETDKSFIQSEYTNSTGCVVFGGFFFTECDYVRWDTYDDYTPVNQRVCINRQEDKSININVSESPASDSRFYITHLIDGDTHPLEGAAVNCGGITGITNENGEAVLALEVGGSYNCSIQKTFYQTKSVSITNVPRDARYRYTLYTEVELYHIAVFSYVLINNSINNYIPLDGVEFTVSSRTGDYEETFLMTDNRYSIEVPGGYYRIEAEKQGYEFEEAESDTEFNAEDATTLQLYFTEKDAAGDLVDLFTLDIFNIRDEESFRGALWKILPPLFIFLIVALGLSIITDRFKRVKDDVGI